MLLPTYHCPTMVAPVVERRATPMFYPIDHNGVPLFAWLDALDLRRVKAMLVPHFFGVPQAMASTRHWCDARGIALIEDCAHALFGRSDGRPIGTWGDVAIGSLTKFLPVSEGGCLVINNGGPAPRLRHGNAKVQLKAALDILEEGARHGRLPGLSALVCGTLDALRGLRRTGAPLPPGPPTQMASPVSDASFTLDLQLAHRAMAGPCVWVARLLPRARIVELRRHNYRRLAQRLSGHLGLQPLRAELPPECAPYVFPVWVDVPDPGYAELRRLNMPVFRWDRLWPGMPSIDGDHGLSWSHHVLQLACHQDLRDDDIDHFADVVLRLFAGAPASGHATGR